MNKFFLVAFLAASLSACGADAEPTFVISNLATDKHGDSEYSTTYRSTATISSAADSLKGKTILANVKVKSVSGSETNASGVEWVFIKDGVGKLDIHTFLTTPNAPEPVFSGWEVVGFVELNQAKVKFSP